MTVRDLLARLLLLIVVLLPVGIGVYMTANALADFGAQLNTQLDPALGGTA